MTIQELRAEIQKAGPVFVNAVIGESTIYVEAKKKDLLFSLQNWDGDIEASRSHGGLWIG